MSALRCEGRVGVSKRKGEEGVEMGGRYLAGWHMIIYRGDRVQTCPCVCAPTVDTHPGVRTLMRSAPPLTRPCLGLNGGLIRARHWVSPFPWDFSQNCPAWGALAGPPCLDRNEYVVRPWADHFCCLVLGSTSANWVQGSTSQDEVALGVLVRAHLCVCFQLRELGVHVDAHLCLSVQLSVGDWVCECVHVCVYLSE